MQLRRCGIACALGSGELQAGRRSSGMHMRMLMWAPGVGVEARCRLRPARSRSWGAGLALRTPLLALGVVEGRRHEEAVALLKLGGVSTRGRAVQKPCRSAWASFYGRQFERSMWQTKRPPATRRIVTTMQRKQYFVLQSFHQNSAFFFLLSLANTAACKWKGHMEERCLLKQIR